MVRYGPFSLHFSDETRVAGQVIVGSLELDLPNLSVRGIEEVHVNLRSQVITKIGPHEEGLYPFNDTVGIWKEGLPHKTELYETDSTEDEALEFLFRLPPWYDNHGDTLRKPFSFTFPYSSPSSGNYGYGIKGNSQSCCISYYVEAVGVRNDQYPVKEGFVVRRCFRCLNSDSRGAELSRIMQDGWTGSWQTFEKVKLPKRFSWRANRQATITLSLPEVEAFPIETSIPFRLNISAVAKGKKSKPITESSQILGIDFTIVRDVHMKAHSKEATIEKEFVARIGSFGSLAQDSEAAMEAKLSPWIPVYDNEKEATGAWQQEHDIASSFTLTCPPSVVYQTLSVKYFAQVEITSFRTGPTFITVPLQVVSNLCAR